MINNISLRDWFAGQAIAGIAAIGYSASAESVAMRADSIADAMMARRAELTFEKQPDVFVMPVVLDRVALRLVLKGVTSSLENAFDWASSRQGERYWYNVQIGRKPLTEADKEYLKEVLARTERKAEP